MAHAFAGLMIEAVTGAQSDREESPRGFVGRDAERAALDDWLAREPRPMLVTGPAGVGKSALVTHWAQRAGHPIARAELAAATGLEDTLRRIGRALALSFGPAADADAVAARIASALQGRAPAMLVLDDADAVIETLGPLLDRLGGAPDVRVLITSRRSALDAPHATLTLGPLPLDAATALLVMRARRVRPDFRIGGQAEAVRALVERVEGLPLGVELLAPRLRVLSPARLVERLEGAAGPSDALHHALDRSFELLRPEERSALAQCTVFRDGFYLEAAEAVVQLPDRSRDVLTVLEALVDQSLLRTQPDADLPDEVRLRFFGAVRDRASETLSAADRAAAEARHGAWFVEHAERWDAGIESPNEVEDTARLVVELPNLEAAYARASDPERAARLGLVLHMAYQRRGPFSHQAERVAEVLAHAESVGDARLVARAELAHARVLRWAADLDGAEAALHRASIAAREADDVEVEAGCARNLAAIQFRRGDLDGFETHLDAALSAAERSGRAVDEVNARNGLGYLHGRRGDFERARDELERALRLAERSEIPGLIALAHASLAATMREAARFEAAERHATAAIAAYARLGYLRQWGLAHLERAEARLHSDDLAGAHDDAAAGLTRARFLGLSAPLTRALALRGKIAFFEQDWGTARDGLEEAASALGDHLGAGRLWAYAGAARAMFGHLEAAEEAFSRADEGDELTALLRDFLEVGAAKAAAAHGTPVELALPSRSPRGAEALRVAELLRETARQVLPGSGTPGVRLEVREAGSWFRLEGDEGVDLTRRRALRGVLDGLVQQALSPHAPALTLDDVLEAGWPGERMSPESGARRVYVTVNRLRKLGLGDLLQTTGDGYRLAPHVDVVRA
ncbi:MAG: tetratricopeptide repeat protein [Sandaracinaceae bacterium]